MKCEGSKKSQVPSPESRVIAFLPTIPPASMFARVNLSPSVRRCLVFPSPPLSVFLFFLCFCSCFLFQQGRIIPARFCQARLHTVSHSLFRASIKSLSLSSSSTTFSMSPTVPLPHMAGSRTAGSIQVALSASVSLPSGEAHSRPLHRMTYTTLPMLAPARRRRSSSRAPRRCTRRSLFHFASCWDLSTSSLMVMRSRSRSVSSLSIRIAAGWSTSRPASRSSQ
ncbi:hypothetical protein B0T19DRAFT_412941 [Cercophora scortea]|uniref:Transmembrane protein n=1 Tax=Cercophora scortea TaxID=314031 RepID=A0AAE0MME9_9PEZI|nr:hypothetical protein B0T19DRAFT_412941 [Cercophora scortea]